MSPALVALAPGKLFLVGEYAVLDGAPAVVAAVDRGVRCEAWPGGEGLRIETPTGDDRFARPALEKPTEALVQSLVVDEAARGLGVGRALMEQAEAWAQGRDLRSVALHTQIMRSDARVFYRALGYEEITQSMLLRKKLD